MKNIFLTVLLILIVSVPVCARKYITYTSKGNIRYVQDSTNWKQFYRDLELYGKMYEDKRFYVFIEELSFAPDNNELSLDYTTSGFQFSYNMRTKIKVSLLIYTSIFSFNSVPLNYCKFDDFTDAVDFWDSLMEKYGGMPSYEPDFKPSFKPSYKPKNDAGGVNH